jgi:hypothetical protein
MCSGPQRLLNRVRIDSREADFRVRTVSISRQSAISRFLRLRKSLPLVNGAPQAYASAGAHESSVRNRRRQADSRVTGEREWCLNAVNQCWTKKAPRIAPSELEEARKAYDYARDVYQQLIRESER